MEGSRRLGHWTTDRLDDIRRRAPRLSSAHFALSALSGTPALLALPYLAPHLVSLLCRLKSRFSSTANLKASGKRNKVGKECRSTRIRASCAPCGDISRSLAIFSQDFCGPGVLVSSTMTNAPAHWQPLIVLAGSETERCFSEWFDFSRSSVETWMLWS